MNIFLIGYMGSGKSTIGQKLAEILNFNFIDLDNYIELKENKSVSEIFRVNGEIYFRNAETKYLKYILTNNTNTIISLGGGTPCYASNMKLIIESENATSIYLKSSIDSLSNRLFTEKDNRPLISHLKDKDALNEFIGKHLFERSFYYNQSDVTVVTDNQTIAEVLEKILLKLF